MSYLPSFEDPKAPCRPYEPIRCLRPVIGIDQKQPLAGTDRVEFRRGRRHRGSAVAVPALADEVAKLGCTRLETPVLVEQLADPLVDRPEDSGCKYVLSRLLLARIGG